MGGQVLLPGDGRTPLRDHGVQLPEVRDTAVIAAEIIGERGPLTVVDHQRGFAARNRLDQRFQEMMLIRDRRPREPGNQFGPDITDGVQIRQRDQGRQP